VGTLLPSTGYKSRRPDRVRGATPIDEQALIEQAKRGKSEAVEQLVCHYQQLAFRVAYVVTRDEEDAKDAAQTAMIKAVNALKGFREGAPFRPWLVRIVVNEAKDRKTASIRRAELTTEVEIIEQHPSPEPSPETEAERAEQRDILLAAVNKLRQEDRLIVAYRYFLGLSEAEMAIALDCPRGTVKSRLSRSLARLREVIASDQDLDPGDRLYG
jgi:RNA polymerase sigma-70 factor (ECF subfamily)